MSKGEKWTPSEDAILRESIASGLNIEKVAKALGRTTFALSNRRLTLKIDKKFAKTRVTKTGVTKEKIQVKEPGVVIEKVLEDDGLWEIESNVPLPSTLKGTSEETKRMIAKAQTLLNQLQVKQSFVVPGKGLRHVIDVAKKDYPEYKLRSSATTKEKKFYRIFRIV